MKFYVLLDYEPLKNWIETSTYNQAKIIAAQYSCPTVIVSDAPSETPELFESLETLIEGLEKLAGSLK